MKILRGGGLVPNLHILLQWYWDKKCGKKGQEILLEAVPCRERGETGRLSIFNSIQHCSTLIRKDCPDRYLKTSGGTTWVFWVTGEHNIVFYAEDGQIAELNPIWLHTTLAAIVRMFKRVGLQKTWARLKKWSALWVSFGAKRGKQRKRGEQQEKGQLFRSRREPG